MEVVICPVCLQKFNMGMANEGSIYKAGYATMCPHCRHTIPKHVVREAQAELKRVMQK